MTSSFSTSAFVGILFGCTSLLTPTSRFVVAIRLAASSDYFFIARGREQ